MDSATHPLIALQEAIFQALKAHMTAEQAALWVLASVKPTQGRVAVAPYPNISWASALPEGLVVDSDTADNGVIYVTLPYANSPITPLAFSQYIKQNLVFVIDEGISTGREGRIEHLKKIADNYLKTNRYTSNIYIKHEDLYTLLSQGNALCADADVIFHTSELENQPNQAVCVQGADVDASTASGLYHLLSTPVGRFAKQPDFAPTDWRNPYFRFELALQRTHLLTALWPTVQSEGAIPLSDNADTRAQKQLETALMEAPWHLQQLGFKSTPDRLCFYANKLVSLFHNWYTTNRILVPQDEEGTKTRLALVAHVGCVLEEVADILSLRPLTE